MTVQDIVDEYDDAVTAGWSSAQDAPDFDIFTTQAWEDLALVHGVPVP